MNDERGADLQGADFRGADLRDANWYGEKLKKEPIQIIGLKYFIIITPEQIKIGCEIHKTDEWAEFSDEEIVKMDGKYGLLWWEDNKKMIMGIAKKA